MDKTTIKEKREVLIKLSQGIRAEFGKDAPINYHLKEIYFNDNTEIKLNTFQGWLSEGFCVRKGEHGYLFWGRPKERKKEGETTENIENKEDDEYSFYPVCFLFSENQVKKLD